MACATASSQSSVWSRRFDQLQLPDGHGRVEVPPSIRWFFGLLGFELGLRTSSRSQLSDPGYESSVDDADLVECWTSLQLTGADRPVALAKANAMLNRINQFSEVQIAKTYEQHGAACLSILTDGKYFQGSFKNLEAVRNAGVQVHNERELDRVLNIDGIQLIGINNRDLETFEVNNSITKRFLEGEYGEIIRKRHNWKT